MRSRRPLQRRKPSLAPHPVAPRSIEPPHEARANSLTFEGDDIARILEEGGGKVRGDTLAMAAKALALPRVRAALEELAGSGVEQACLAFPQIGIPTMLVSPAGVLAGKGGPIAAYRLNVDARMAELAGNAFAEYYRRTGGAIAVLDCAAGLLAAGTEVWLAGARDDGALSEEAFIETCRTIYRHAIAVRLDA